MSVGYRALLRLDDGEDAIEVAERGMREWLGEKARPGRNRTLDAATWNGPGVHRLGGASTLHVVHADDAEEGARRRLFRLIERNEHGEFAVSLQAASLSPGALHRETIVVEVGRVGVERSIALRTVSPPRIVRLLLDSVRASDGVTRLTGRPRLMHRDGIDEVLEAIRDPERTASVIVAGSYGAGFDATWLSVVESLTRQSVGVATAFVVADDAIEEFDAALPITHRVDRGRVRTYLPKVDLDDPADGLRHKWLRVATVSRSTRGTRVAEPLQRRHAEQARRRMVELELPGDVRRSLAILQRAEAGVERVARVEQRVAAARAADARDQPMSSHRTVPHSVLARAGQWLDRIHRLLTRWLGVVAPDLTDLERLDEFITRRDEDARVADELFAGAVDESAALDVELTELRARNEDLQLDAADGEQRATALEREVFELRRRLIGLERTDLTHVEPEDDDWNAPDSVDELLTRLTLGEGQHPITQRVVFTGDTDIALEVDRRDQTGRYAHQLWLFARVLHDYAVLRAGGGIRGGVHAYLEDDSAAGTKCGTKRHTSHESETVQNRASWRDERLLPVPRSVDASGRVYMFAHFKPTHRDRFAPRMHYFDDTAEGGSGRVYIGYIGRHLTTSDSSSG